MDPIKSSTPSQQRLTSALSASYIDSDIRNALAVLDTRFVENTAESRRQLRVDVQANVIRSNAQIIRDFSQVAEQLTRIGTALDNMSNVVSAMRIGTSTASAEAAPILEESTQLLTQKKVIEDKQMLLSAFTDHFTVSDEDIAILTSSVEPVDDRFFNILQNVKRIHNDCQVLLASGNERVGTEIMDEMVKHLHAAFQKLFRWVQRELKTLSMESPQVNSGVRRALKVLAERPTLFQNCLDFFAEARQKILLDSFYTAMTGSAHGSTVNMDYTTKPIEVYAHDPLRYIGDMFAWLHSTAVSEQEALEVLFISQDGDERKSSIADGVQDALQNEPWAGDPAEEAIHWDPRRGLMQLVDKNLSTVAKPFKARIEQAIATQESSTLTYKLTNLINFYRLTFLRLLSSLDSDSTLLITISSLEEASLRQFYSILQDHVRSVMSDLPSAPANLSPPLFLLDSLKDLTLLMKSYETSLSPLEEDFTKILENALDPYLEGCFQLSRELESANKHIFSLNCILAVRSTLEPFTFTTTKQKKLQDQVDDLISILVEYQTGIYIHKSGLHPLMEQLKQWEEKPKIQAPFTPEQLQDASFRLDGFLSEVMDAQTSIGRLASPAFQTEVLKRAAGEFIEAFRRVEEAVMESMLDEYGEEGVRMVWPRTVEEVQVLLS
ncbi:oligomeric Golgi complex subunit 6 [Pyronema domesticum]|uniref:Conserved oligomeric Golgi complex subunit 6 n=1 Tax=Pyronema omphalodes (strain CBS 100304) TaxID=1076935 RepID=U4LN57_PYROM|nr:oligomeric Golgi complex subunit 6 [Pyronema domesticum]CCX33584.1 Similar to Conserved oligomeric Golgi complex subunit 6; acc. no. Q0UYL3 [Pyronema omphalodes CBS 100304]